MLIRICYICTLDDLEYARKVEETWNANQRPARPRFGSKLVVDELDIVTLGHGRKTRREGG